MNLSTIRYKLKIRPNNQGQFEVLVTSDMLVSELKLLISGSCSIPSSQQRLISSGKLLKDDQTLSSYKLSDGHVIQLSSTLPEPSEPDPPESSIPSRRDRSRLIDQNERCETIRQSLQTINSMFDIINPRVEDETIGFDMRQRKFILGQWVDVLDTVEQWLEAQIIEIANTSQGALVFVHYSGWPAQWDEWIDSSSPRIQPFHSYTNQSITAPMYSPHPTVPIDGDNFRAQGPPDTALLLRQGSAAMQKMKQLLERYYYLSTVHKHEKVGEKIGDLRNRLGLMQTEEIKEWTSDEGSFNGATIGFDDRGSVGSVEIAADEGNMTTEAELSLLTVQTAPLLDRTGRLMSDLATLIPTPSIPVMPSPAELSQLTTSGRSDIGIHIYAFLTPRRNN